MSERSATCVADRHTSGWSPRLARGLDPGHQGVRERASRAGGKAASAVGGAEATRDAGLDPAPEALQPEGQVARRPGRELVLKLADASCKVAELMVLRGGVVQQ